LAYLDQMLHDPLPRPRIAAARSLGRIGSREHISDLKETLHDQDAAVQATVAASLIRLLRQDQQAARAHS
jgi:HEAT repeat protein